MFPLLKLPFLCIQAVLQNTSPLDLIHFSLTSKRSYRLLKLIKSPVKMINFYMVERKISFVDFYEKWWINKGDFEEKAAIRTNINGEEVKTFMDDIHSYTYTHQTIFNFFKAAVPYLLDIFKCEVHNCFIDVDQVSNLTEIFEFGVTKCQHLRIQGGREVREEEMQLVIEKITTSKMELILNLSDVFYCNPDLFKTEILGLSDNAVKWLTCDTFLRFQRISEIRMTNRKNLSLVPTDFIAFISQWYHSDNRQFRQLSASVPWQLPRHLLKRFKPIMFNPKRRGPVFRSISKEINSADGVDILRRDGLLATVYQRFNALYFHVWHEPFPDFGDTTIM